MLWSSHVTVTSHSNGKQAHPKFGSKFPHQRGCLGNPSRGGSFPLFSYYKNKLLRMCLRLSSLTLFMNWPPALCKACWGLCPQTPAQGHSLMFIHFSLSSISNSKQHSSWVYSSTCLTIQQHIKFFISHSFQLLFSSSYPYFQPYGI